MILCFFSEFLLLLGSYKSGSSHFWTAIPYADIVIFQKIYQYNAKTPIKSSITSKELIIIWKYFFNLSLKPIHKFLKIPEI